MYQRIDLFIAGNLRSEINEVIEKDEGFTCEMFFLFIIK